VFFGKDFGFFSSQNNFSSLDICFTSLDLLFIWFCGRGKAYTLNAFIAFLVFHATLNFLYFNIKVRPYRVETAWYFSGCHPTGGRF
jgi:hypothetical protein